MTQHIFVRPVGPKKIRDEYSLVVIPPSGAWVKPTRFVARRIRENDLERCAPPVEAPVEVALDEVTDNERPRRRGKHESEG